MSQAAVFLLASCLAFPLLAADTPVNVTVTGDQERQSAIQLTNGTLVFVFEDESVSPSRVQVRRFDSTLAPLSVEQRVNVATNLECSEPVVAALTGGGFVVGYSASNLDGAGYGIAFRRYDSAGGPLDATDVLANTVTAGAQFRPQITALTNGGFMLAWLGQSGGTGQDVFYRRFAANGLPLDPTEIRANALGNDPVATGDQGSPHLATLRDGSVIIVYEDRSTDDLFAVRIGSNGSAVDAPGEPAGNKQFQINVSTSYLQSMPDVAPLTNGGFVVTYNSETNGTSGSRRILGRLFSATGAGGVEFGVGSHAERWQDSRVAGLANGDFVVTWQARGEGADAGTNSHSIFEQRFSPAAAPRFTPFMVNTFNTDHQSRPSLAPFGNSGYVIAWESRGQDGSGSGVFARVVLPNNEVPGYLTIAFPVSQQVAVRFDGQAGRQHQLQRSTNLVTWTTVLTTNVGSFQHLEPNTNSPRFFRVQSL